LTTIYDNYLVPSIRELFTRIEYLKGYVFQFDNDIRNYSKILVKRLHEQGIIKDNENISLKASRIAISDLTEDTSYRNYYSLPTEFYEVSSEDFADKNDQLIQVISSLLVAQAYDAMETFLKHILILYFENNPQIGIETIGKLNCKWNKEEIDWENTVKKLRQGENNKELLKILRILSPEFNEAEIANNRSLDLPIWFNMISIVRHSIVHSNAILKPELFNGLGNNGQEILTFFFNVGNENSGNKKLIISAKQASRAMEIFCEFGFLMFKSLSKTANLNWRILKGMD
jgi:hypothetical protein